MAKGASARPAQKPGNTGSIVGALFSVWTILFVLIAHLIAPHNNYRLALSVGFAIGAAIIAAGGFASLSEIAIRNVAKNPIQLEEGFYCPWAYLGGIAIGLVLFGLGAVLGRFVTKDFSGWVLVLLIGNCAVVAVTWWSHLVIGERSPPLLPDHEPEKNLMEHALQMEAEFLRSIITALTQAVYLVGAALLGAGSIFLSQETLPPNGFWLAVGLGAWILGLHLGMTSPFMRRHGAIIRAYRDKALNQR